MCPYVSSGKISLRVTAHRRLPLQDSLPTYHTSGQHMCSSVASAHASCCAFCADAPTPLISGASRQLPGHSVAMRCMYIGMYLCMYGNINSAFCDGIATIVTAAHHFIWRHLHASMQAARTPASRLRFVTPDKESSITRCGRREILSRYAAENH